MNKQKTNSTPSTKIFRGMEEVKKAYQLMLSLSKDEIIYSFVDQEGTPPKLKSWLDKEFEPKRIAQKVSKQSFITTTKIPKDKKWGYIQYDKSSYSARYLVDPIDKPFVGEVSIFGDKIAFINFSSKQMYAVVIEDSPFAQTMKSFYLHYTWKL